MPTGAGTDNTNYTSDSFFCHRLSLSFFSVLLGFTQTIDTELSALFGFIPTIYTELSALFGFSPTIYTELSALFGFILNIDTEPSVLFGFIQNIDADPICFRKFNLRKNRRQRSAGGMF